METAKSNSCFPCHRKVPCVQHSLTELYSRIVRILLLYLAGVYHFVRQLLFSNASHSKFQDHCFLKANGSEDPIVIISGVTSGIGLEIYKTIDKSACLILLTHPGSSKRNGSLIFPHKTISVDFSDLSSTQHACNQLQSILSKTKSCSPSRPIVMIHCAGTLSHHTLMVNSFMPALMFFQLQSYLSSLIVLGSATQSVASEQLLQDTNSTACFMHHLTGASAYPLSKALLLSVVNEWRKRTGKPAVVIHPGIVHTKFYESEYGPHGFILRWFTKHFAWTPSYAARRVIHIINESNVLSLSSTHEFDHNNFYWDAVTLTPEKLPDKLQYINTKFIVQQLLISFSMLTYE